MNDVIGMKVKVYDRYLFAVPVIGVVTGVSIKGGALKINFEMNNPGRPNVIKHSGQYFFHQQCRLLIKKENKTDQRWREKEACHQKIEQRRKASKKEGKEEVILDGSKYRFYIKDHSLHCDRYNEPWKKFTGDRAVLCLFYECLNLKEKQINSRETIKGVWRALVALLYSDANQQVALELNKEGIRLTNDYGFHTNV